MLICAAGDTHGELDRMYDAVARLEGSLGREADLVVQVGDFGAWPDPARLDEATRRHGDSGAFRRLVLAGAPVPRPTVFIAGNHEDFAYLADLRAREIVPGLWFLPWGETFAFEARGERVTVAGAGGCYGAKDYGRERLTGAARRHYTERELRALARMGPGAVDVLLLHEPPAGLVTELHAPPGLRPRAWDLAGAGLGELVASLAPRVCFTGHIHARTERRIAGVRTVGLNKVAYRGSVIAFELPPGRDEPRDLAEWGGAPDEEASRASDDDEAPAPFDDAALDALAACLRAWAVEICGERAPDRAARMRLHAALAGEPLRAAMMSALLGTDPREILARSVAPQDRAPLLGAWRAGALPNPAVLRAR